MRGGASWIPFSAGGAAVAAGLQLRVERAGAGVDGDDGLVVGRAWWHVGEECLGEGGRVNGGFFVLEPEAFDYIDGDATVWEREPMEQLAHDGQLSAFTHRGFWQPMDTLRDKLRLEELWQTGRAPWKVWT